MSALFASPGLISNEDFETNDEKLAACPQDTGEITYTREQGNMQPRPPKFEEAIIQLADALNGQRGKSDVWRKIQAGSVAFGMLVFAGGMVFSPRDKKTDDQSVNIVIVEQKIRIEQLEREIAEQKRINERENRLNAEYFRQLAVALERAGIRVPETGK